MNIVLSKKYLGTSQSFIWNVNENRYFWSDFIPDQSWVFGDSLYSRDLGTVAEAAKFNIVTLMDTKWGESLQASNADFSQTIPWHNILPSTYFKQYIKSTLDQLWLLINKQSDCYHIRELIDHREFLLTLQRAVIDKNIFKFFLENAETENDKNHILTFSPDNSGFCKNVIYSQTSSSTGRLVVKTGPRILTLKKKYRKILKSSFKDGKIFQIDLVSLEPRIALRVANRNDERDIYSQVSRKIFKNTLDREKAKIATISCLYGMSARSLRDKLPEEDTAQVIDQIRAFFGIQQLKRRLSRQSEKDGFITNFYDRKIMSSGALVNNYVQSTGVDVSLDCFKQLCQDFTDSNIKFRPLFVVHDALIVDIEMSDLDRAKCIINKGLFASRFKEPFPAKIEENF